MFDSIINKYISLNKHGRFCYGANLNLILLIILEINIILFEICFYNYFS